MTNHEAIQFLDNMKHEEAGRAIGKDGFYAELMGYHVQALNMAIEALEKEPCYDCISRDEAINPFLVDATEEWTSADIVKYLKSLLSVMPTMRYPQVPGITPIVVLNEEE